METWFPTLWTWILDKILASMTNTAFPYQPKEWNFTPFPSTATTTPLVADAIYPHLQSGFATPVAAVQEIAGPKSVRLADDRLLEDIDAIIYCTGYDFCAPCAPAEYDPVPVAGQPPHLYRNIFPLHDDPAIVTIYAEIKEGHIKENMRESASDSSNIPQPGPKRRQQAPK